MEVHILGAHHLESSGTRLVSLLVDGRLAVDAGSLTRALSFSQQQEVAAILLSHHHFDHFRDIVTLGLSRAYLRSTPLYAPQHTLEALAAFFDGGRFYPDFFHWPEDRPVYLPRPVEPDTPLEVEGYRVLPCPVSHAATPTVGYQVTSPEGRSLFYSSDTGAGLSSCWPQISPHLIITEVSGPEQWRQWLEPSGHLTPAMLREELQQFHHLKGYLPPVVVVHINPMGREEIGREVEAVSRELGTTITLGVEGMRLQV
jgi:ribonuclease BN (tRNA processing enzyme)